MNSARIIGYRRDGCPIREIRGGSEPVFGQGDQGGGQGDQQGQGGGQDNGFGDLLDSGGQDSGGDGGDNGQGGQDGDGPPLWWQTASQGLIATITQQTQSEIDRRINQLTRRQGGQQNGQQGQGQQGGQQGQPPAPKGVDRQDLSDARLVFRDELGDLIRLSQPERELVNLVQSGLIRAALERGGEPDQVGSQVAREVADRVRKLRAHNQDQVIGRLEQMGALDRSKIKQGTPNHQQQGSGPGNTTPAQAWGSGAGLAGKIAQERGFAVPGQQQQQ